MRKGSSAGRNGPASATLFALQARGNGEGLHLNFYLTG